MSGDTKWIIGTVVVLAGLLLAQMGGLNARIDDVRISLTAQIDGLSTRIDDMAARLDRIETRLDGFDARLRDVEIAFDKVDQRLLTPRAHPANVPGAGRRVAHDLDHVPAMGM